MLTCIACTKHLPGGACGASAPSLPDPDDDVEATAAAPSSRQALKALTSQIKDMALKASGAYRHCSKPCSGSCKHWHHPRLADSDLAVSRSEGLQYSKISMSRLVMRGFSSGDGTPSSAIGRIEEEAAEAMEEEEDGRGEANEWVAQVEYGVMITFVSVPDGGNDLKRIRFSRELFNKGQAQRWWAENHDKVMELYNVQSLNCQATPFPTSPRSEGESSKIESAEESPVTPPLSEERLPRDFPRPVTGKGMGYSSSESFDHHPPTQQNDHLNGHNGRRYNESGCLASTPKLSSISGPKTETSSVDAASMRTSSEADRSEEVSVSAVSKASDQETEWVEQDEPGVYITIRQLLGGIRELRRVRFRHFTTISMHRLQIPENKPSMTKLLRKIFRESDYNSFR